MTYPTHAAFTAQLGTAFEVSGVALELVSVSPVPGGQAAGAPASFSLVFLGDETLQFDQGMHPFAHPALGAFDLFIVPLGPARSNARMQYEAVFN